MSWLAFTGILALFFMTHSIPIRPPVRTALVQFIGERGFTLAYSLLSLGMLAIVIAAAGEVPHVQLWPQMPWQHHVVHVGMLVVCLIVAFTLGRPNPFSFGGARNHRFDPALPGIVRWVRHPVLLALLLWSLLHLLPNGNLGHVILFGIFAGFSLLGGRLIDRRKQREMGKAQWQNLLTAAQSGPLVARPTNPGDTAFRLACAVAAYAALILLHPVVIGVPV